MLASTVPPTTLLCLLAVACSGDVLSHGADAGTSLPGEETTDAAPALSAEDLFPLELGRKLTYRYNTIGGQEPENLEVSVEALENMEGKKDGILAYRVKSVWSETGQTEFAWYERRDGKIVNHRNAVNYYMPYLLVLDDETLRQDTMWTEILDAEDVEGEGLSVQYTNQWKVEALDDELVVPAGTFRSVRIRKTIYPDGAFGPLLEYVYWYASGVGLVKRRKWHSQKPTTELVLVSLP
jgi:hypothetical protein